MGNVESTENRPFNVFTTIYLVVKPGLNGEGDIESRSFCVVHSFTQAGLFLQDKHYRVMTMQQFKNEYYPDTEDLSSFKPGAPEFIVFEVIIDHDVSEIPIANDSTFWIIVEPGLDGDHYLRINRFHLFLTKHDAELFSPDLPEMTMQQFKGEYYPDTEDLNSFKEGAPEFILFEVLPGQEISC